MNKAQSFAAVALLAVLGAASRADAQATAPNAAAAARLAKLKARQDAIIAAAKAKAATTATTPTAATATPAATTAKPVVTAAPTTTATPAASASAKPVASATAATSAVPAASATHPDTTSIALDLDALKKSRPDRRHAEFLDLQARFGSLLADPRAVAELKQHGQRIAYLQRIRALGVKANDANFVKSVDALITTEETRDASALNALRTSALPVAPAATAVATAATAVAVPVGTAPAGGTK